MAKKKSCTKCGGADPCAKCAEIKKRRRAKQPKVIRLKPKQVPIIVNLQQPPAPYLPSLANQYMNIPFQRPPMGNQLAQRIVPAVIPDDYIEPVAIRRAPSVQGSIRSVIQDESDNMSDVTPESYGYYGSLPSLYQSEQSFRENESLPSLPAPIPYPTSYPQPFPQPFPPFPYFQSAMQQSEPLFEPVGRASNNLPSAPISLVDDFEQELLKAEYEFQQALSPSFDIRSNPKSEEDFSEMSERSVKSDIPIPPSFEERTFVASSEPILPIIPSVEIPTAVAMPISKGEDITPVKAINPALVDKLKADDIRVLNLFEEIKNIPKSERTPEQADDFKRGQYLRTQQRDKVDAFISSDLYQPTYTPEKIATGGGGGEGPILAEKVNDFSNYTEQDRSDLENYRDAKGIKKSERTTEQQRIVDRVDKTLSKRKNYNDFLNSGKVIAGGIPVASEPFFFEPEDTPITGAVSFNIPKPLLTKRSPSVFETRAMGIPESINIPRVAIDPLEQPWQVPGRRRNKKNKIPDVVTGISEPIDISPIEEQSWAMPIKQKERASKPEDKPVMGSVSFNIPRPLPTKRQPSVFETKATVIPESIDIPSTEIEAIPTLVSQSLSIPPPIRRPPSVFETRSTVIPESIDSSPTEIEPIAIPKPVLPREGLNEDTIYVYISKLTPYLNSIRDTDRYQAEIKRLNDIIFSIGPNRLSDENRESLLLRINGIADNRNNALPPRESIELSLPRLPVPGRRGDVEIWPYINAVKNFFNSTDNPNVYYRRIQRISNQIYNSPTLNNDLKMSLIRLVNKIIPENLTY
jgi:hypothetical protein